MQLIFLKIFHVNLCICLLIYQYRSWRDSCLWINFVKSNSTAFWITFLVDLSLTLWLLLTLQVKYFTLWRFFILYVWYSFFFLVLFFMLWIFNIYFFSLKWKSSEPRFFTLHWSFWPYEFLSTGKAVHSCFSLSLYVCIFLNMRCKISFNWMESLLPYSVNPLWIHELYIPSTEKNWKDAHNNLGNCLSNKEKNQLLHWISPKKMLKNNLGNFCRIWQINFT